MASPQVSAFLQDLKANNAQDYGTLMADKNQLTAIISRGAGMDDVSALKNIKSRSENILSKHENGDHQAAVEEIRSHNAVLESKLRGGQRSPRHLQGEIAYLQDLSLDQQKDQQEVERLKDQQPQGQGQMSSMFQMVVTLLCTLLKIPNPMQQNQEAPGQPEGQQQALASAPAQAAPEQAAPQQNSAQPEATKAEPQPEKHNPITEHHIKKASVAAAPINGANAQLQGASASATNAGVAAISTATTRNA